MKIGGIEKTSLIDWPGLISCVIFTCGCNFRCPYCYNAELVYNKVKKIEEKEVINFLKINKKFIDGVILSGGEPTLQNDIINFCKKIKKLGFRVGIETNGSKTEILKKLIKEKLIDYVAMDIKTSIEKYERVIGRKNKKEIKKIKENVKKSIELIKNSKIEYEFRITVVPKIVGKKEIKEIGKLLGRSKVVLQQFKNNKCLNKNFEKIKPYSIKKIESFASLLKKYVKEVGIRE